MEQPEGQAQQAGVGQDRLDDRQRRGLHDDGHHAAVFVIGGAEAAVCQGETLATKKANSKVQNAWFK